MKECNFDEMIAYFNRRVSEMDIAQDYKMELLGMIVALGYKHEKTAQPERKKGKWIRHNTYHGDDTSGYVDPDWRCSECGKEASVNYFCLYDLTDFCPNCGADLRGAQHEVSD